MKTYILILFVISSASLFAQKEKNEPVTVNYVDLSKYTGLWYEIAKIPNSFQDHCFSNTTARYSLHKDGTIEVINSCRESDGEIDSAEGIAQVVDTESNSKLEVSFVSILGFHLFWGDYWIIGLDEEYSFAVIGTPNKKYGWILSRTKKLSEKKLSDAYGILRNNGYKISDFVLSRQD